MYDPDAINFLIDKLVFNILINVNNPTLHIMKINDYGKSELGHKFIMYYSKGPMRVSK